jgi:hypothetical protein
MNASLVRLMEDLIEAFECRETAEPGDRVGQVAASIRHLELQIAERLEQLSHAGALAPAEPEGMSRHRL